MPATVTSDEIENELAGFREKLNRAGRIFKQQSKKIENLEYEADEAGLTRDKALYWLLRICDAAEREGWQMSEEAEQDIQHARLLLGDNNIFVGLDEPDAAILRLMEIVAPDLEAAEEGAS